MSPNRRALVAALLAAAAIVSALVFALRSRDPPLAAPSASASAPLPPAPELPSPFGAWLDCSKFAPPPPASCPPADDAVAELVRAASGFSINAMRCTLMPAFSPTYVAAAKHALDRMAGVSAKTLVQRERIVAQNAALRIAICAGAEGGEASLEAPASALVRKLALTKTALDALGDAPDRAVDRWIGERGAWTRFVPVEHPLHEVGFGYTRLSSPTRASAAWANIGQLVAVDTDGNPHVTPLVGELDIRAPLAGKSTAVCAASLDVAWLRCGVPGGLRRLDLDATNRQHIEASAMFAAGASERRCLQCHIFDHPVSTPAPAPAADAGAAQLGVREKYLHTLAELVAALPGRAR